VKSLRWATGALLASLRAMPPDAAAATVILGLVLGTCPVYGASTGLCLAAAFLLRRNAAALQLVNQAVTPVQALMLLPFLRVGESLLGRPALVGAAAGRVAAYSARMVAGWVCLMVPAGLALYILSTGLLRRRPCASRMPSSIAGIS